VTATATKRKPLLHERRFYGDVPILHPRKFLRDARRLLKDVDFDTVVGTGLSGVPAATLLGNSMGKHILLVRKEDDKDNHHDNSGMGVVGRLGKRWIFVDDFMSSGATRRRVMDVVKRVEWGFSRGYGSRPEDDKPSTYVGSYLFRGQHSWDEEPVFVYARSD
jgi:hypothetical protein